MSDDIRDDYIVEEEDIVFEKRDPEEIVEDGKNVDTQAIAEELLLWLSENAVRYADNQSRLYRIDLIVGENDSLKKLEELQNLWRAIPDDQAVVVKEDQHLVEKAKSEGKLDLSEMGLSKESKKALDAVAVCRENLDEISADIMTKMQNSEEMLDKLFESLIYFYEMKGISKNELLIQNYQGCIKILDFNYDNFDVGVSILDPFIKKEGGDVVERDMHGEVVKIYDEKEIDFNIDEATGKKVIRKHVVDEGFSLAFEIGMKKKELPKTLF